MFSYLYLIAPPQHATWKIPISCSSLKARFQQELLWTTGLDSHKHTWVFLTLVLLLNSLPTSAIAIICCGLLYAHLSSHYSIDFFREWAKFFYVYIHSTQILLKEIINYNRSKYKS